jgi:hypothetical protein
MNRNQLTVGQRVGYVYSEGSKPKMGTVVSLTEKILRRLPVRYGQPMTKEHNTGILIQFDEPNWHARDGFLILGTARDLITEEDATYRAEYSAAVEKDRREREAKQQAVREAFAALGMGEVSVTTAPWSVEISMEKEAYAVLAEKLGLPALF